MFIQYKLSKSSIDLLTYLIKILMKPFGINVKAGYDCTINYLKKNTNIIKTEIIPYFYIKSNNISLGVDKSEKSDKQLMGSICRFTLEKELYDVPIYVARISD